MYGTFHRDATVHLNLPESKQMSLVGVQYLSMSENVGFELGDQSQSNHVTDKPKKNCHVPSYIEYALPFRNTQHNDLQHIHIIIILAFTQSDVWSDIMLTERRGGGYSGASLNRNSIAGKPFTAKY